MQIMPFREQEIENTIEGLQATNVPLVAMDGDVFHAAGLSDNNGIYYFCSLIGKHNLTANSAIDIFLLLLLSLGSAIVMISFFFYYKSLISKIISSVIWIGFSYRSLFICPDIYLSCYLAISATVPLLLLLKKYRNGSKGAWMAVITFSGIVAGYSDMIREYAGTTAILFIAVWIALEGTLKKREKGLYLFLLCLFFLIPYVHEKALEKKRDTFLAQHHVVKQSSFPTWHLFYIGLGYFENDYGIRRVDGSAMEKAQSINPDVIYLSEEYNAILKNAFFSILRSNPWFVIKTFLLKFLIGCWMVIKYTNIGLLLCFYVRPNWRELVPYLIAGAFGLLPGVVAEPTVNYILGTLALSVLFAIHRIGMSIEKYRKVSQATLQLQRG